MTAMDTASAPDLIDAMSQPAFYAEPAHRVEVRQTHTSVVFLIDDFAYKLRKAVVLPFIDCSTPAKRRALCKMEVALNRRLAADVYCGVVPIVCARGKYSFGRGSAPHAVDFAVKMRRLPDDRRLDHLVENGRATVAEIEAIARRLADFHRAVDCSKSWAYGSAEQVRRLVNSNLEETRALAADNLTIEQLAAVADFARRSISSKWELIDRRAREGRVRDGHGDLRGDSVYLLREGVRIIDALEFSEALRYCDVASELAFLAMDLERLGRADFAAVLSQTYAAASGDVALADLLPLYKAHRALVRAKVELIRSGQDDCAMDERILARARARRYLDLAAGYAGASSAPPLIVVCGLSGTGKTTLAAALRQRLGLEILSADAERKRLAGVAPAERLNAAYGAGAYSADFNRRVYQRLMEQAEALFKAGRGVIIDATFRHRAERVRITELAHRLGVTPLFVECQAEPDEVIRRLVKRRTCRDEISDAGVDVYLAQRRDFEPLTEIPSTQRIVSTAGSNRGLEMIISAIEDRLHPKH